MHKKVSLIVPVYNVKPYLRKCVNSIKKQDYENIEIILVDDGSTDGSSEMCDELAKDDARIRVIHQKNQGLSGARNTGTKEAIGDYIAYVDSDDWVSENYISHQMAIARDYDADIVVTKQLSVWEGNEDFEVSDIQEQLFEYNKIEALEALLYGYDIQCSACKLFKANLIKKHPFPMGALYEDLGMMYKVFGDADKVVRSTLPMYFYRRRAGSIINGNFDERHLVIIDHAHKQYDYIALFFPSLIKAASYRCAYVVTEIAPMVLRSKDRKVFNQIQKELFIHKKDLFFNKKAGLKVKVRGLAILCGIHVANAESGLEVFLKKKMKKDLYED